MQQSDFDKLCEQARATLAELRQAGDEHRRRLAEQYGVEPEQVELWVTENETAIEPVIRPPRPPRPPHKA